MFNLMKMKKLTIANSTSHGDQRDLCDHWHISALMQDRKRGSAPQEMEDKMLFDLA